MRSSDYLVLGICDTTHTTTNLYPIRHRCWNGGWEEHLPTACAFPWSPIQLGDLHKHTQTNHNRTSINTHTGRCQNCHGMLSRCCKVVNISTIFKHQHNLQWHIRIPKWIASQPQIPAANGRPFTSCAAQTTSPRISDKVSKLQQNDVTIFAMIMRYVYVGTYHKVENRTMGSDCPMQRWDNCTT